MMFCYTTTIKENPAYGLVMLIFTIVIGKKLVLWKIYLVSCILTRESNKDILKKNCSYRTFPSTAK